MSFLCHSEQHGMAAPSTGSLAHLHAKAASMILVDVTLALQCLQRVVSPGAKVALQPRQL